MRLAETEIGNRTVLATAHEMGVDLWTFARESSPPRLEPSENQERAFAQDQLRSRPFLEFVRRRCLDPVVLAYRYGLGSGATTVVIGPKSVAELDTAIEAEAAAVLDVGEMTEIDRLIGEAGSLCSASQLPLCAPGHLSPTRASVEATRASTDRRSQAQRPPSLLLPRNVSAIDEYGLCSDPLRAR